MPLAPAGGYAEKEQRDAPVETVMGEADVAPVHATQDVAAGSRRSM